MEKRVLKVQSANNNPHLEYLPDVRELSWIKGTPSFHERLGYIEPTLQRWKQAGFSVFEDSDFNVLNGRGLAQVSSRFIPQYPSLGKPRGIDSTNTIVSIHGRNFCVSYSDYMLDRDLRLSFTPTTAPESSASTNPFPDIWLFANPEPNDHSHFRHAQRAVFPLFQITHSIVEGEFFENVFLQLDEQGLPLHAWSDVLHYAPRLFHGL